MNLTLRSRILIIVSLVVFLILAISISLVVFSKKKAQEEAVLLDNNQNIENQIIDEMDVVPGIIPTKIPSGAVVIPQTQEEFLKTACLNLSKVYVERYGSYSTDNPGKNLKDLEVLSTTDLWKILKNRMDNLQVDGNFFSVVTKAIGASFDLYSKEKATVIVMTSKEESKNGEISNYNQEVELILVGSKGSWLVDDIKWK